MSEPKLIPVSQVPPEAVAEAMLAPSAPQGYRGKISCWSFPGGVVIEISSDAPGLQFAMTLAQVTEHIKHLQACIEAARRT